MIKIGESFPFTYLENNKKIKIKEELKNVFVFENGLNYSDIMFDFYRNNLNKWKYVSKFIEEDDEKLYFEYKNDLELLKFNKFLKLSDRIIETLKYFIQQSLKYPIIINNKKYYFFPIDNFQNNYMYNGKDFIMIDADSFKLIDEEELNEWTNNKIYFMEIKIDNKYKIVDLRKFTKRRYNGTINNICSK